MHSMEQYYDGCEVHDASGIANRAFYLAATGIGGYAWEKTGRIWFEAYDSLKRTAGFAQAARATVVVAEKRFGAASPERKAIEAAWQKVKVLP
jgi:Zn-dependent metalloprotease